MPGYIKLWLSEAMYFFLFLFFILWRDVGLLLGMWEGVKPQ